MRSMVFLALALSLGCSSGPTHHLHMINARRTPRAAPCVEPTVFTDRGPETPRENIAVLTSECSGEHPEQCRRAMQIAACEADADAVVEATARPLRGGRVRLVGTAVVWQTP